MDKIKISLKNKAIAVYPDLEELNVTPTTNNQTITPLEGYAFNRVNVSAVTNAIDTNIKAENIKKNVTILGIEGTLESAIAPVVSDETLIYSSNARVEEGSLIL